ncbi:MULTISPECIES: hypothetical protein [Serratia]|uniref:hypothetical protein n=1 Tax=Serratia TaxID=613 RepID=UPI000744F24E|nr:MULTISPECIES: hypothetical protein [Serratia]RNW02714.1 hypothetical protein CAG37_023530 [Serratia nematodiphila]MBH2759340.1 hypothetical protein [Serratia ureilytica]MDP8730173.1 hypothetical protein [Serratia marcescens]MDS0826496.1 hypothetical protein [Serratia marcescens]PYA05871.1 hypothetical protein DMW43_10165 [Serratia marcescens]
MEWEWLLTVFIIPIGGWVFKVLSKRSKNLNDRIDQLENRVQKAELKLEVLNDDIEEIKMIRAELSEARIDIGVIKQLLEQNNKGA